MNPRALAIAVLARVEATDAWLNVVLDSKLAESPPTDPRDSALVSELCYGATRRRSALDAVLARFSQRRLETLEDKVLAALRLGAYQLFYMRVPRHAAVAETVGALDAVGMGRAKGFVNAILRKVAALDALPLPPKEDLVAHLAMREGHPEWLVARWIRQLGPARAEAMLEADNRPAPVCVRVNGSKGSRDEVLEELRAAGLEVSPTATSPSGLIFQSPGRVESLYGYAEGLWQVQDEAAQLVCLYAEIPDGARVLDVCAAPGGKACQLAERCEVLACDLHAHRLRRIESEARRLGLSERLKVRVQDATLPLVEVEDRPEGAESFDAVLVDAPCTGLGTLRRHPELRWRRKEEDIGRLESLQRKILENAQAVVPPGGLLIYAVCSVEAREGPDQLELFLRSHPDFTVEPPSEMPGGLASYQGCLRTLPGPEGLDGFFAARLRRLT